MVILIILILIYVLSVIGVYNIIRKIYSKGGRWEEFQPKSEDVFFTFFPLINTILFIVENFNGVDLNKFYRIKK